MTKSVKITTTLPEFLKARLDLRLWDQSQNRVPKGAYKEVFSTCVEKLNDEVLDLGPYLGVTSNIYTVSGSQVTITKLRNLLDRLP